MEIGLVSIVCICYNQEDFVAEALDSVLGQSYDFWELIIVDNGSKDTSQIKIQEWLKDKDLLGKVICQFHPQSINYCKAFNDALALAKGEFVIDLSGDDVLLPAHVENSVKALDNSPKAALCSSDAELYMEETKVSKSFFPLSHTDLPANWQPKGDVYKEVIKNYCLCTPSMVFRSGILKEEGGYDENLVYEDFDIIVRLARKYDFAFSPHMGVKKRLHKDSFAKGQYKARESRMLPSTLKVCEKIAQMNQSPDEDSALVYRCLYEAKHALASANFEVAQGLLELAGKLGAKGATFKLLKVLAWLRLDIAFLYQLYTRN